MNRKCITGFPDCLVRDKPGLGQRQPLERLQPWRSLSITTELMRKIISILQNSLISVKQKSTRSRIQSSNSGNTLSIRVALEVFHSQIIMSLVSNTQMRLHWTRLLLFTKLFSKSIDQQASSSEDG